MMTTPDRGPAGAGGAGRPARRSETPSGLDFAHFGTVAWFWNAGLNAKGALDSAKWPQALCAVVQCLPSERAGLLPEGGGRLCEFGEIVGNRKPASNPRCR